MTLDDTPILVGASIVTEGNGSCLLVMLHPDNSYSLHTRSPTKEQLTKLGLHGKDTIQSQALLQKRAWEKEAAITLSSQDTLASIRKHERPITSGLTSGYYYVNGELFLESMEELKQLVLQHWIPTVQAEAPKEIEKLQAELEQQLKHHHLNLMQQAYDLNKTKDRLERLEIQMISKSSEQQHSNPIIDRHAFLSPGEKTILEKYKDEAAASEMEAGIKELQRVQQDLQAELRKRDQELRQVKRSRRKSAGMVQTFSLSAIATILVYLIVSKIFHRPIPTMELVDPSRMVRGKRKRRRRAEDGGPSASSALPPGPPPFETSKTRTRSKTSR